MKNMKSCNKEKSLIKLGVCVVLMFFSVSVFGWTDPQETTQPKIVRIILKDGSELIGTILSQDEAVIKFRTMSGVEMTISIDKIKSGEPLEVVGGKVFRPDPNQTRLFLAPTARPLQAGQGYFSAYEIFFPYFAIGITDNFALGGGITLIPGLSGQFFYIAPKLTPVRLKDFDLSLGALYLNSTSGSGSAIGVLYGLGTIGNKPASLTVGLGWGYSGEGIANNPILMIGGELQVSNSIKFLSENWIPFGSDLKFLSFGVRFFGRSLAADFGFMLPIARGEIIKGFPLLPWLGFTYNFGGLKK